MENTDDPNLLWNNVVDIMTMNSDTIEVIGYKIESQERRGWSRNYKTKQPTKDIKTRYWVMPTTEQAAHVESQTE